MSLKWTNSASETGILRKNEPYENKEELLVFGYSCKLFRDDEKAQQIDQGKHLIPWMGDDTLKIDRYDARGTVHELSSLEAPPGGHDWRHELSDMEKRVEQLCDEERYRALYCDENEEEMYKEEELKRLHAKGAGKSYGQVGFTYDSDTVAGADKLEKKESEEEDEPFVPKSTLVLPEGMALPETVKLNAIIEKTAGFIASHGVPMEILLKAKQAGNPQFDFLSRECPLHAYYLHLIDLIRNGTYYYTDTEATEKNEESEMYLHPSLATPTFQLAPSIPSIQYRPSADCDYTMLITRIQGTEDEQPDHEPSGQGSDLAPPGTVPLTLPRPDEQPEVTQDKSKNVATHIDLMFPMHAAISKAPVIYSEIVKAVEAPLDKVTIVTPSSGGIDQGPKSVSTYDSHGSNSNSPNPELMAKKSSALGLMQYYNSDSESESECSESDVSTSRAPTPVPTPPHDTKLIIDKMAAYVARNGDDFEKIVRTKQDPRFSFLDSGNQYHAYYRQEVTATRRQDRKEQEDKLEKVEKAKDVKTIAPVSFSIKKLKEPEPILPKPALPYESSSGDEDADDGEGKTSTKTSTNEQKTENSSPQVLTTSKSESNNSSTIKESNPTTNSSKKAENGDMPRSKTVADSTKDLIKSDSKGKEEKEAFENQEYLKKINDRINEKLDNVCKKGEKDGKREKERRREREERRSKREKGDRKVRKSKKEKKDKRYRDDKKEKRDIQDEPIVLDGDTDELIDLTGELSDEVVKEKGEESSWQRKQAERRRRAAAFLSAMARDQNTSVDNVDAVIAPALEQNTLASVMVRTLYDMKTKVSEEEHRRKRKRRHHDSSAELHNDSRRDSHYKKSKRKKYSKTDRHKKSTQKKDKKHKDSRRESHKKKSRKRSRDRSTSKTHTPEKPYDANTPPRETIATVVDDEQNKRNAIKHKLKELLNGENSNDIDANHDEWKVNKEDWLNYDKKIVPNNDGSASDSDGFSVLPLNEKRERKPKSKKRERDREYSEGECQNSSESCDSEDSSSSSSDSDE